MSASCLICSTSESGISSIGGILVASAVRAFFRAIFGRILSAMKSAMLENAAKNGQIGYRTGTQHNQKNKIRRTCIHPFCQYHQSRDRGHEQADDNDYRQQNHITVDLTEIHCAIFSSFRFVIALQYLHLLNSDPVEFLRAVRPEAFSGR